MEQVYRYSLKYNDFLKLVKARDFKELQSYLFLQSERLEVEVYLEEVILSTIHSHFPELNMKAFNVQYRNSVLNLLNSILSEKVDNKEVGREYFKTYVGTSKYFLRGLLDCYMSLIKHSAEIQKKLLIGTNNPNVPINIVVSSVILNKLATIYTEYPTNNSIVLSQAVPKSEMVADVQLSDYTLNLLSITDNSLTTQVEELAVGEQSTECLNYIKSLNFGSLSKESQLAFINGLANVSLFEQVYKKYTEINWDSTDKEIVIPYFNNPSRQVRVDLGLNKIKIPS